MPNAETQTGPTVAPRAAISTATAVIEAGESLSVGLNTTSYTITALLVPADWEPIANLTFQVSADGVNFFNVYDAMGNEVMISAKAGSAVIVDNVDWMQAVGWIKFRSGSADYPVAQDGQRTLTVFMK